MCYSYSSSIGAWLFSLVASIFMLANNDIYDVWLPIFILTFTQIQVLEAGIWTSIPSNISANSFFTALIPYLLLLQPLVNSGMAFLNTKNSSTLLYTIFIFMIIGYTFLLIANYYTADNFEFISTVGENGHLVWERIDKETGENNTILGFTSNYYLNKLIEFAYLIGLFVPILFMPNKIMAGLTIGVAGWTFLRNYITYGTDGEFGTMWCYSAVILSVLALLFNRKID